MSDELLKSINTKLDSVHEKLIIQNGRLDKNTDAQIESNLVLREVVTVLANLPCDERLESCQRAMDLVVNGFKEKKTAKRAKSSVINGFLIATISAAVGLLTWVATMAFGG